MQGMQYKRMAHFRDAYACFTHIPYTHKKYFLSHTQSLTYMHTLTHVYTHTHKHTHAGIEDLADYVLRNNNGRNVYCLGAANIGKSTLVNALAQSLADRLKVISCFTFRFVLP